MFNHAIDYYYDRLADVYDAATSNPLAWRAPSECFNLLRPYMSGDQTILDLGIGTGRSLRQFTNKVTGLDISRNMLARAHRNLPKATLLRANIEKRLPLSEGSRFNIVLAVGVFEFVGDFEKMIDRILPHLCTGGMICFTYEELLPMNDLQRFRCSPRSAGLGGRAAKSLSFPVYRRTWLEVKQTLKKRGFDVLGTRRFRAYSLRSARGRSIPVRYRAVLARRFT